MDDDERRDRVPRGRGRRLSRVLVGWLLAAVVLAALVAGLVWMMANGPMRGQRIDGRPLRRGWRRQRDRVGTVGSCPPGRWSRAALDEAAAVLAFDELLLELAALGAPDDLVERAASAANDERRHAARCRAIARGVGEVPVDSPLREPASPRDTRSRAGRHLRIAQLAVESCLDGSINERAAAERLRAGAAAGPRAPFVPVLLEIADDEDRHAELADDIVAWARTEGGRLTALSLAVACRRAPFPRGGHSPGGTGHTAR